MNPASGNKSPGSPAPSFAGKLRLFGFAIILVFALFHIPRITARPVDHHSWRQVTTVGVARCFYLESANPFHPRVFERGDKSGITGMEFPLYNFIIFLFMKLFGYAEWYGRLISLSFALAGLFWFWRFAALQLGEDTALLSLFVLATSPLYFFFSRNIQPDIAMVALLAASLYYIGFWADSGKGRHFWLASILLTLAALVKLPAIVFLPYHITVIALRKKEHSHSIPGAAVKFLFPVLLVGAWYAYSAHLVDKYDLKYFYLGDGILNNMAFVVDWRFFKTAIASRLPEVVANFASFPFLLIGLACFRKIGYRFDAAMLLLLALPYYLIGGFNLYVHDYYSLPLTLIVALFAGSGAGFILRAGSRFLRGAAIILLLASAVVGITRTAVWYKETYPEFTSAESLVKPHVPQDALLVAAWRADPTLLFFTYRNGWPLSPETVDLDDLYARGARYLITTDTADSLIFRHDLLTPIAREPSLRLYMITGGAAAGQPPIGSTTQ